MQIIAGPLPSGRDDTLWDIVTDSDFSAAETDTGFYYKIAPTKRMNTNFKGKITQ